MFISFFEAVRFLTVIPLPFMPPMTGDTYEQTIARSMRWFPLVGLLIGGIAAAVGWAAGQVWGDGVRVVLMVVVVGIVTAGLHLDGLSDTFDAVVSWRPRERKLEIMKDSRIGAMGALALIAVIALKIAFLLATGEQFWRAMLLACMLGRWADLYGIFRFPAAREGGLGKSFREFIRRRDFVFATALMLVFTIAIVIVGQDMSQWRDWLMRGSVTLALVLAVTHVLCVRWVKSLGGLTGDTYGALCEIGEVVALAAMGASITLLMQ
jgi:adenosylcobinamide-GDP ribazoletransferase